jgi:hypothetical protein
MNLATAVVIAVLGASASGATIATIAPSDAVAAYQQHVTHAKDPHSPVLSCAEARLAIKRRFMTTPRGHCHYHSPGEKRFPGNPYWRVAKIDLCILLGNTRCHYWEIQAERFTTGFYRAARPVYGSSYHKPMKLIYRASCRTEKAC